jgi:hypothetical protein
MPPRRPPRPVPPDVDILRAGLDQGKLVRVGIAPSGQFPDGVTGRVRRIGDPAVDGDEFIFVEVPVGGTKDVLPFAPNDLVGAPARRRTATPTAADSTTRAARPMSKPASAPVAAAAATSPPLFETPRPRSAVADPSPAPARAVQPTPVPAAPPVRAGGKAVAAAGRGKRAPVSITISTTGDESASWRIEARIGAKTAVRPTSIPPTRVWEIVQSLGEPKLTALVQSLLDDHRRSTQARAAALAAELSALQAELESFPE